MINIVTINCKLLTAAACNLQRINSKVNTFFGNILKSREEKKLHCWMFDMRFCIFLRILFH